MVSVIEQMNNLNISDKDTIINMINENKHIIYYSKKLFPSLYFDDINIAKLFYLIILL